MTKYDEPRQGMSDFRRTEPNGPRRIESPQGRRVTRPDIIDGEVVAVEVHDDPPASRSDGAELQDSLDQIERLAAELKEIAEVITPTSKPAGPRATTRPVAPSPATGRATVTNGGPARAAGGGFRGSASAQTGGGPRVSATGSGASAPTAGGPSKARGTGTAPTSGRAQASAPTSGGPAQPRTGTGAPAGPRFDAHNAPSSRPGTAGTRPARAGQRPAEAQQPDRPASAQSAPTQPGPTQPGPTPAAPTKIGATQPKVTMLTEDPLFAWDGPASTGHSVLQEPLPPEPKRRADEELVFGVVAPPVAEMPSAGPPASIRAEKSLVDTAALPVVELGVAAPGAAPKRNTAPAGRSESESRRPSGRPGARRGRYTAIIIGAFALAVPAFALGAVQPWNTANKSEDKLSVSIGDRAGAPPLTGGDPSTAVPNPNPSPSAASAAPLSPREVTAGVGGDQPKTRPATQKPTTPPTHRNSHPVGLALTVHADDVKPTVGESVRFKLTWKDGAGHFGGATQQWGDGSPNSGSIDVRKCSGQAPASSGATEVTHTFREAGTYTVRLSVTTYTCDGQTETQTVPMTITVEPKPSPTPTTEPSPTESPKPGE